MQYVFRRDVSLLLLTGIMLAATVSCSSSTPPATTAPAASTRPAQTPVLADNTVLHADIPYGGPDAKYDVLDIYAARGVKHAPVLLFVHGGEWTKGDKLEISSKPKFFNEHGVIFVSINYRLNPQYHHPAQVDDLATAIAWTKAHIAEYGGLPDDITIMGHSAGCHLVTLVALDPRPLAKVGLKPLDLHGVIAWSGGMYDLAARSQGTGLYPPLIRQNFGEDAAAQQAASPISYVANAMQAPPFSFVTLDDEKSKSSREAAEDMVRQIQAHGGHATLSVLHGISHFDANHLIGQPDNHMGEIILGCIGVPIPERSNKWP